MKVNNENFDKVLNKLVASTRSPRGRFTAENSWKLLESRLLKRRSMKRFWMRTASAAAVVLLCVTSWAAYQFLYVAPQREAIPTEAVHTTEETQVIHSVLTFDQQPLQEIVRQLSETFRTDIRIEGDSLKNYPPKFNLPRLSSKLISSYPSTKSITFWKYFIAVW